MSSYLPLAASCHCLLVLRMWWPLVHLFRVFGFICVVPPVFYLMKYIDQPPAKFFQKYFMDKQTNEQVWCRQHLRKYSQIKPRLRIKPKYMLRFFSQRF